MNSGSAIVFLVGTISPLYWSIQFDTYTSGANLVRFMPLLYELGMSLTSVFNYVNYSACNFKASKDALYLLANQLV